VAKEVAKNPQMLEYARRIEEQQDDGDEAESEAGEQDEDGGGLPDSQEVVDELERFLREQRGES
jgi:hypothetical protein